MDEQNVKNLLEKYNAGLCTDEEKAVLETWYLQHNQELPHGLSSQNIEQATDRIWARLDQRSNRGRVIPLIRYAAAASVILGLSIGGYFILHKQKPVQQTAQLVKNDIAPGSNKAILTLANGKQIVVAGATKGIIARQANMTVNKTAAGQLNYQRASDALAATAPLMNTLSTQMGGETSLTLADGTEVKLDAASSITYPVAFNGKERRVSVTGQVRFKVKHNAKQPFYVTAGGQTIEDIGTEFNINAYEHVKTTLIEGKIVVNGKPLIPGQQAILVDNQLTISEGDPEEAAAWANGYFRFNNENIHSIMDKIKRWYNIDVTYDPDVTTEGITGTASRYKNISQVFYMLSYGKKVHFKIEGRRVTVLK